MKLNESIKDPFLKTIEQTLAAALEYHSSNEDLHQYHNILYALYHQIKPTLDEIERDA